MEESSLSISCEEIEAPSWLPTYETFVLKVLKFMEVTTWEIAVIFCDNPFIHRLNKEFRGKDEPTDILSFPYAEEQTMPMGDLIISLPTLRENSLYFKVSEQEELKRLTIHGILHLMGWDHETNDESEPMLIHQEEVLRHFQGDVIF